MKASPYRPANEGQAFRSHQYPESVDHAERPRIWRFIPLLLLLLTAAARADMMPPPTWTNLLLCSWSFTDTNTCYNDNGYAPVSFTNITSSALGIGPGALVMDSPSPAWLGYNVNEIDGTSNLTLKVGTVMMWLAPNWTSTNQGGTGPGQSGRLIEVGTYTTNANYGWWSLYTDSGGGNLYFAAQDEWGGQEVFLTAPISWGTTNAWHHIALTYSSTNTSLYLEGSLVTNGSPLTIWPNSSVQSNGFTIGSDGASGVAQIHGIIDEVSTYNFEVDAGTIGGNYLNGQMGFLMNPLNIFSFSSATSTPTIYPTFNAITGNGNLTPVTTNAFGCVTNSNIWITNVSAVPFGTNGAMSLTFTIAGGSNGVPYDVFATSYLQNGTNTQWAWMGAGYQCVTYTLTNLASRTAFLILGFPTDSDGDGLTDAYEILVSHTNPEVKDTSGDGMWDSWKVLWGLNPSINNVAQPALRSNYGYTLTDWLNQISGIRTGSINLDAEGNVTSASQ